MSTYVTGRRQISLLSIHIILLFCAISISLVFGKGETVKEGEYVNTYAKDILVDAPWFVANDTTPIPVEFMIRDADVVDLNELEALYIEVPSSRTGFDFSSSDTIFAKIYDPIITDLSTPIWDTLVFIDLPTGYSSGEILYIRCTFDIEDGLPWGETYSQILGIQIGRAPLPKLENWYLGDCHYHTSITDNPYEDGGRFQMISQSARAMGLDFVTATDHASDSSYLAGVLIDDLNESDWENMLDSFEIYGDENFIFIRGEEADIANETDSRNHFLIYGNNEFFSAPIPETFAVRTHTELFNFLIDSPEAIGYVAHPYNPDYYWEDSIVFHGIQGGAIRGLQIWNERTVWDVDVDVDIECNPFPFYSGDMWGTDGLWDNDLIVGLEKWDYFLNRCIEEAIEGIPRQVFIDGGSDAHGDFNYFTYHPFILGVPSPDVKATSNAFAKVRTMAYCPDSLSDKNILDALYKGHSIATDGPVINMTAIVHNEFGRHETIIGEMDTVIYGADDSLKIVYKNTDDFGGELQRLRLKRVYQGVSYSDEIDLDSFLTDIHDSFSIPLELPIEEGWCCLRLEAYTFEADEQYITPQNSFRCFANPIWFFVQSDEFALYDTPENTEVLIDKDPMGNLLSISGEIEKIQIFNLLGKCIFQKSFTQPRSRFTWHFDDNCKSGIFLIRGKSRNKTFFGKIFHFR